MDWLALIFYYCIWTAGLGIAIIYSTTKDFKVETHLDTPKYLFVSLVSFVLAGSLFSNMFSD